MIINGPNLNLVGKREPSVYGNLDMDQFIASLQHRWDGVVVDYYQSNVEGELIDAIQRAGFHYDGIVINAGGYSHTSVALHDAITAIPAPVVEVHISNIFAREEYRHHSLLSSACKGVVVGMGLQGYVLAIQGILMLS